MRATIGMLGTGLVTYMQNQMWRGAMKAASERGARLIYYPTINLNSWPPFPPEPKALFDLVDGRLVDGLLVWYAGIFEGLGVRDARLFFRRYGSIPLVTIGGPLPDRPDLSVDNYRGTRACVDHLIEAHHRRSIAAIRGPAGHPDADQRYRAYADSLSAHGLPLDGRRVAEIPFEIQGVDRNATRAVDRWLSDPGLPIDAIVAASDYMALAAIKAIEARGLRVPEDIAVVGFDDVEDSQASAPSVTTVRQPFFEMGYRAVEIVLDAMGGGEAPLRTLVPPQLVLRESCGCLSDSTRPPRGDRDGIGAASQELGIPAERLDGLLDRLGRALPVGPGGGPTDRSEVFLAPLRRLLFDSTQSDFAEAAWQDAVGALGRRLSEARGSGIGPDGEALLERARVLVAEAAHRSRIKQRIELQEQSERMRQISEALITAFDEPLLIETLHRQLPQLGFPSFYLSLYARPEAPSGSARLILAYERGGPVDLPPEGAEFPSGLLFPGSRERPGGSLVVEPLYFRDEQIGILVLEPGPTDGPIYENLRAQISSALQGSKLLKQVQRHALGLEREVAERTAELTNTVDRLKVEISERRRAEKALSLASFAIGRVSDAIFWISPDGSISDVNDAACLLLGYERRELVGRPMAGIDAAFRGLPWAQAWERISRGDSSLRESVLLSRGGGEIPVEAMDNYIVFEDITLVCSVVRDIRRRKENESAIRGLNEDLERRVAERTRQLEEANGELESFAYSISHDLRAPLRAIDGFSAILSDEFGGTLPREAADYLGRIRYNTLRMGRLIEDLLSFSRSGRSEIHLESVDSVALVKQVIADLSLSEDTGAVDFIVDESLPPCRADPAMLRQVWTNLVSNAVKYSSTRERARVEITHALEEGRIVYRISDNGVGFDMRWADKLFGVFQRLHSLQEFEGTGIGLAIAKRIVKRHDGDIAAFSAPGKGATFSFYLGTG